MKKNASHKNKRQSKRDLKRQRSKYDFNRELHTCHPSPGKSGKNWEFWGILGRQERYNPCLRGFKYGKPLLIQV